MATRLALKWKPNRALIIQTTNRLPTTLAKTVSTRLPRAAGKVERIYPPLTGVSEMAAHASHRIPGSAGRTEADLKNE
jgi:hypothetical protein